MSAFTSSTGHHPDWGTLAVRLAVGAVMITAGWMKFFVVGMDTVTTGFEDLGIPLAGFVAYFIAALEVVGGILLVIGLFARPIAFLLICDMIAAIFLVSVNIGWMNMEGKAGIEENVLLIAGLLVVFLGGAGRVSLDGRGASTTA